MGMLSDFGFSDFQRNIDLTRKHKGDVNLIVAALTEPAAPQ